MKKPVAYRSMATLILLTGSSIGVAFAGDSPPTKGDTATLTRERAAEIAIARVPGGKIIEGELEKEHGKLVWSFDIARAESRNVSEVQVDAMTGEIVAEESESPEQEAAEASDPKP